MAVSSLPVKQQVYLGWQLSQELFLRANVLEMQVSDRIHFGGTIFIRLFASGAKRYVKS
jgi:hypothetical protein